MSRLTATDEVPSEETPANYDPVAAVLSGDSGSDIAVA